MRSGRILLGLLLLVGILGTALTGSAVYARLIYLGALLGAVSWAWTRWVVGRLRIERVARAQRANVGDVFDEYFELFNASRLFAPWVEISDLSNLPNSSGSRLLTMALGKQKRTYASRIWLTRRGAFALGPTRLTTGDPFGFFRASVEFPAEQRLVVLPMLFEIESFLFPPGLLPGGQVIRKKSEDITPHAAGIREYVPGDAMKRIHWASSMKRNQLMVKEFEQDPQAQVWLYLDAQRGAHSELAQPAEETPLQAMLFARRPKLQLPPSTLEYAISAAASLAHYFIARRRAVGYISASKHLTIHTADRSERQEAKILETLAFTEADGELSIAALVAAQVSQLPQGSSAVILTANAGAELLAAIDDLQRRYMRPMVVLIDAQSFGGQSGAAQSAAALQARRVPFCVIHNGDNLSESLRKFSASIVRKDFTSWQASRP
ncbi:MAG: DUF58 domain-containing protein [Anaerolineales bacterium]